MAVQQISGALPHIDTEGRLALCQLNENKHTDSAGRPDTTTNAPHPQNQDKEINIGQEFNFGYISASDGRRNGK
jgi:hypothetical protein